MNGTCRCWADVFLVTACVVGAVFALLRTLTTASITLFSQLVALLASLRGLGCHSSIGAPCVAVRLAQRIRDISDVILATSGADDNIAVLRIQCGLAEKKVALELLVDVQLRNVVEPGVKAGNELFHSEGFVPGVVKEIGEVQIKLVRSIDCVRLVEVI